MNFLELTNRFPITPIKTDEEHDKAIKIIDSLVDIDERNEDEDRYLTQIADLVFDYENKIYPDD